jgi:hypothetical protein
MEHRLVGHWTLERYEAVGPDGARSLPFGRALGRLSYDEHGHMAGQVMQPERPPGLSGDGAVQRLRAAYTGYIAYFGRYEVNETGDTVTHHVEGALNPAWVGGTQIRRLRFDGDRLELRAEVPRGDDVFTHVLIWRKLP